MTGNIISAVKKKQVVAPRGSVTHPPRDRKQTKEHVNVSAVCTIQRFSSTVQRDE